jgi:hypothetical protein
MVLLFLDASSYYCSTCRLLTLSDFWKTQPKDPYRTNINMLLQVEARIAQTLHPPQRKNKLYKFDPLANAILNMLWCL